MPKEYDVLWTETAEKDLIIIIDYFYSDNPAKAIEIYLTIKKKCLSLNTFAARGRIVPELKEYNIEIYREIIEKPWRIIYKIEKNVCVLARLFIIS